MWGLCIQSPCIVTFLVYERFDVFAKCNWIVTQWQYYSTHLQTNNTQNNTMKQNTQNGTYITIRIHKHNNKNTWFTNLNRSIQNINHIYNDLSICLPLYLLVYLCYCLQICLSIHLFVCLSVSVILSYVYLLICQAI